MDFQRERRAGILLHPTSLPGPHGVGDLGPGAEAFLDWAAAAGQTVWQVLPLGPTSLGDSPYGCLSAFAGNPLLVSPERLVEEGLLPRPALAGAPAFPIERVDFAAARSWKERLLRASCAHHQRHAPRRVRTAEERFAAVMAAEGWLDDWTLFCALKEHHGGRAWTAWDGELRRRAPAALAAARRDLAAEIAYHRHVQFVFFVQWEALRARARERGVLLVGDLPIYVAGDSADVWSRPDLFQLDEDGHPAAVAGVPPDYFSPTGQLWGNPLYRWERMAAEGFAWWVARLRTNLRLADLVRVDHFRGFAAYWEVPAGEPTAENGRWRPAPGRELFAVLRRELGGLPIVAEDLGVITPDVEELRAALDLPGMKVLQFAFGDDDNPHAPHHHTPATAVYTGTHDNDTTRGWWTHLGAAERGRARDYLGGGESPEWDLIRAAYTSVAALAVVPLQDVLGLGSEARMNVPARAAGNWSWRFAAEALRPDLAARLRRLATLTGRWVAALLAAAVLPAAGLAQPTAPTFTETVDVEVVTVEVLVTDRDGRPVAGLVADDFEIFEDGRRMAITNFYAEEAGAPAAAAAAPAPAGTQPAGPPPADDDLRLCLAVVVDTFHLTPQARNRALTALRGVLAGHLRPGDRVLLAVHGRSLDVRLRPTADVAAFGTALEEVLREAPADSGHRADFDLLLRELDQAPTTGAFAAQQAATIRDSIRLFAERRVGEVKATLRTLRQFVGSLGGLPGRKLVLFVTEGLPMRPSDTLFQAWEKKYATLSGPSRDVALESMSFDASADLSTLLAAANAGSVTFYTLAVGSPAGSGEQLSAIFSSDLAAAERFNATASLVEMAGATGGFAAIDANQPGPLLRRALGDAATYYSLGYVPPPGADSRVGGKTHRLEVRVKRPGLRVRHRESYAARTGAERTRDRTLAALVLGEPRNPLGVGLLFGEARRARRGRVAVEVTVTFPLAKLVLLPADGFHEGRATVFIGSRDGEGRTSELTQIALPIRVPDDGLAATLLRNVGYKTQLLLRQQPHQVVVGLRDEVGKTDSTYVADYHPR